MKRTISGVTYDTDTAEEIADAEVYPLEMKSDHDYSVETLYLDDNLFFLTAKNYHTRETKIIPLDRDDALMWFNQHIEK